MRTIASFGYAGLYLLKIFPKMLWLRHQNEPIKYHTTNKLAETLAKNTLKIAGTKVTVLGLEHKEQGENYLYLSNHQGNFDIPILLAYVEKDLSFISKKSLENIPLFGEWMANKRCVFINQDKPREAIKQLQSATKRLHEGTPISLFPEGHRSKGTKMREFGNSGARMSKKSGVKVLPITIKDSYKIMEKQNGKIKPAEVTVIIHPAINPSEYESISSLNQKIEKTIQSGLS
ncbi:1-acyl-sn-glycerol-3-phosphate acyltransferase [Bacillus sp. TS-2]|nr:1-acyl-sn-glycerol-3-phosphate acyltransferase [Bacillus sp. TS-2]